MKASTADPLARPTDPRTAPARFRLSWSDFQLVLAVAQAGQLSQAAKALATSHVTLLRKLASIETRLKTRLFSRTRGHYTPTAAGEELVQAAQAMAPLAQQAEMRVLGQDLKPSGHVRITAASVLVSYLMPQVLRQFASAFPDVTLELLATRNHLSLSRREADVALRVSDAVPDWLVGRQLAMLDFRVYGLKQPGLRQTIRPLSALLQEKRWIAFESDARDLKFDRWIDSTVPASSIVLRVDGFPHALAMLRAGLGIALLPDFLQHTCPELQPLTEPIAGLRTPLWLITHKELRDAMRIKVVMQALGPAVTQALRGSPA
jgi:DNA-binding transcriptional LysR family regulator